MPTAQQQITDLYPETAPYLQNVPEHVVDHVGSIALQLTHEDMHPKQEVRGDYGRTVLRADLTEVITDPEYDSSQLAEDAVEAAHAGKQKLADVLLESSKMLHAAHQQLVESGFTFGASEIETDEHREARERTERDQVYQVACEHALEAATKASISSESEVATASLESLLLLRSMSGVENRKILRTAVRSGLAQELLTATQTANKLFIGTDYDRVSSSMWGAKELLALSVGKELDYNYQETSDVNIKLRQTSMQPENLKDIVAIMTSKHGWLTPDGAFEMLSHSTVMKTLKVQFQADASPETTGSPDYTYALFESVESPQDLLEAFKASEPQEAVDAAKELGIQVWQVNHFFGHQESHNTPVKVDTKLVGQMTKIKDAHPQHFNQIVDSLLNGRYRGMGGGVSFLPDKVLEGFDALVEVGLDKPEFADLICYFSNASGSIKTCQAISEACASLGVNTSELKKLAETSRTTDVLVFSDINSGEISAIELMTKLVTTAEIFDKCLQVYELVEYPNSNLREAVKRPELSALPHIEERLMKLGLPREVVGAMYASWTTYDAYGKYYYKDGTFNVPLETPDQVAHRAIARDQTEALIAQIDSLEYFVQTYGLATTESIISTFGIYNFARHKPEALADQNDRWHNGEKIQTVVVDARNDWNTYTSKAVKFEEETGQGVFYFEANSGRETARVAINVGKHERENGREPDVSRFVVHAHGNRRGMAMGVNGESIDISDYLQVAEGTEKVNNLVKRDKNRTNVQEANDYKKHLGENFSIILQSCSTAELMPDGKNIAEAMHDQHAAKVYGSNVFIRGLTIRSDGSVKFTSSKGDGEPVIYGN